MKRAGELRSLREAAGVYGGGILVDEERNWYAAWNDSAKRWEVRNGTSYQADLIASSQTIEGLEANLTAKLREVRKRPFKRTPCFVLKRYSDKRPVYAEVTSWASDPFSPKQVWILKHDSSGDLKAREKVDVSELYQYDEKTFEAICDLKMFKAEADAKVARGFKAIAEGLTPLVLNEKDHPKL